MKRCGTLMPEILLYDNLMLAFAGAAKGKSDRKDVIAFRRSLDKNIRDLQSRLAAGTMTFGQYRFFTVHDPKTRQICAAAFVERVAHHALMNVCGPILDRSQIHHSYACRTGKGQHKALKQAAQWANHHDYYLKMDIARFFDSIDHTILKTLLARRIKDKQVLALLSQIIDSYHTAPGRGLPLGNLTSQCFANFYLNPFDLWIKQTRKARHYIRYMDDMLIPGDKPTLVSIRDHSETWLNDTLGLRLKHGGQINRTDKGIGFLGSVVYPGMLRMQARAKQRITARMKTYEKKYQADTMDEQALQERACAVWAGLMHINSLGWRKNFVQKRGSTAI
jgi:RNA-directed DNA polymerase